MSLVCGFRVIIFDPKETYLNKFMEFLWVQIVLLLYLFILDWVTCLIPVQFLLLSLLDVYKIGSFPLTRYKLCSSCC